MQVTISGSGFGSAKGTGTVWLGSTPGRIVSWSDTQVVATVASNSTSGSARVQQGGAWSNAVPLNVTTATISSVAPPSGVPGTQVTITGSGFGAAQGSGQVWLGTAKGVVQSWSDTQVVAAVATGSTSGNAQLLQNGVLSNAVQFTVNTFHLSGVSPASGAPGTSVTFTGAGFGSSQGTGTVLLGSTAGQVLSWSDTQAVAKVDPDAVTGIACIQQNGVCSNAFAFTVQTPGGSPARLEPNLLKMMVGDTHTIQAISAAGQPVTGLTWTSSDPNVVSLSSDDPPLLTALAAGHVTIKAGAASADVTVFAEALPLGTVLWSNPGNGSGVDWIVPAVPSSSGVADVFAFQTDHSVQAITSAGTTAWTADLSQVDAWGSGCALPDFQGGLVFKEYNYDNYEYRLSIVKLEGMTGQRQVLYSQRRTDSPLALGVHPDGTIFAVVYDLDHNDAPELLIGIDSTTGAQKFSVPIPGWASNLMIAGDGYAYLDWADRDQLDPGAGVQVDHLGLLRVNTAGASDNIKILDWTMGFTEVLGLYVNMITNADQGVLLTWEAYDPLREDPTLGMAITTGTSVSLVSPPQVPGGGLVNPVLQAQDGSFVGTTYVGDSSNPYMIAFDASGNVRWSVPHYYPRIATADGGVIASPDDGSGSAVTFDQNGNATGQMGSLPTYSWWGYAYEDGPVTQVVARAPRATASWWAFWLANSSANSTAQRPWFVGLVDCQSSNAECQQHGWTKATGGPNEWIYNGLKSLLTLLATPCDPNGTLWAQQACNIDQYVFTSNLKDANGKQSTGADFAAYLRGASPLNSQYPSFYDGLRSYLPKCDWTAGDGCVKLWTQNDDFSATAPPNAGTIIFDKRTPPKIPRMRTFFRSAHIFPELLGVAEPNNMATVFHEALHAYTRLPDQASILWWEGPSLKNSLGCLQKIGSGSYDITAYLLQFTTFTAQQLSENPKPCSYFADREAPPDPQQ